MHGGSLAECVRERERSAAKRTVGLLSSSHRTRTSFRDVLLADYADSAAYISHVRQLRCYFTDKSLLEQNKTKKKKKRVLLQHLQHFINYSIINLFLNWDILTVIHFKMLLKILACKQSFPSHLVLLDDLLEPSCGKSLHSKT